LKNIRHHDLSPNWRLRWEPALLPWPIKDPLRSVEQLHFDLSIPKPHYARLYTKCPI
jgi:hypothetical protein